MSDSLEIQDDLSALFNRLLEGQLTDSEHLALSDQLRNDPDARDLYAEFVVLHSMLQLEHVKPIVPLDGNQLAPELACSNSTAANALGSSSSSISVLGFLGRTTAMVGRPVVWSVLAASLLFASYFVIISWNMLGKTPNGTDGNDIPIAVISDTQDAEWSGDSSPRRSQGENVPGDEVASIKQGEPLKITSGLVGLKLKQGTTLIVEGPAEWSIDGENRATLRHGKLVAKVPQQAIGFTLETPTAKIIDLGTEFGVEVTIDGVADVEVMKGEIDVRSASDSSKAGLGKLRAGQSMRIASDGMQIPSDPTMVARFGQLAQGKKSTAARRHSSATRRIDLSQLGVASQSTDYTGRLSLAKFAIDENVDSFTGTANQDSNPWWQVDLGRPHAIAAVVLHNRKDQCQGRLRDITVTILAEDGKTVLCESELLNPKNEAGGGVSDFNIGPSRLAFDVTRLKSEPVVGRYLRVKRIPCEAGPTETDRRQLCLGEVEVFEPMDSKQPRTSR